MKSSLENVATCWVYSKNVLLTAALLGVFACTTTDKSLGDAPGGAGSAGDAHGAAGGTGCDPLAPSNSLVTLVESQIIDAGTDSDGTVYVLTEQARQMRLFVTTGATLEEKFATSTAETAAASDPVDAWTFQYQDAQRIAITVEVQKDASGLRMGVARGTIPAKGFDIGSVGSTLTQLDAATAAAMEATTAQTFHVEYSGTSTSGQTMVVTAPDSVSSLGGFRVFLGPDGDLAEEAVTAVTRSVEQPSPTFINLTVDGAPASLDYQGSDATLRTGEGDTTFSGPAVPAPPDGAVFECL
jgi:hypothetical protein